MEEKKYSLEFTIDELVLLLGGVGLVHKEGAENFYKSLEGLKSKEEELSIDDILRCFLKDREVYVNEEPSTISPSIFNKAAKEEEE